MSALELLTWARGPGLSIALAVCAFGILLRLFEIFSLDRKTDLSKAREHSPGSGWRTILSRSLPPPGRWPGSCSTSRIRSSRATSRGRRTRASTTRS